MSRESLYRIALAAWSFIAGLAVMFAALWLMDMTPSEAVRSAARGEFARAEHPMWTEYASVTPEVKQVSADLMQDRSSAIVEAVEQVSPAVVSISLIVERRYLNRSYEDYFNYFYNRGRRTETARVLYPKVGTGFIINADGIIVTNHHVIAQGSEFLVTLQDGREYPGKLVGASEALDIAVLKISGDGFPFAVLGDSDGLTIGEWAIAIGNPFGSLLQDNQPTVTVGVISAVKRQFVGAAEEGRYYQNMIQTDAAINPGNSGGPLVNSGGEVIGINTFIFSQSGGNIGLGFARPINEVKRMVNEILTYGKVREVDLGVGGQGMGRQEIAMLNLPNDVQRGIMITYVAPDGPAAEAGIERGDIIYAMDGIPVKGVNDALAKIHSLKVGDVVELSLYREGRRFDTSIVARERK
jgi:serine protease Do